MSFVKFKSLDVEKGRDITVTVDLSDIRECVSYGAGYRGVVTTHWAEYTVTSDECERIEALLMPSEGAKAAERSDADADEYARGYDAGHTAGSKRAGMPADLIAAYQRYAYMCRQTDARFDDASWASVRMAIIAAVAAHMPQQENKTDE